MYRLTANSTVPLRKTKSFDEGLITGSRLTTDTELELNHYIQGGSTVGLSANTEFGLNRSIHRHSTDDSRQNYEVPLSQFNLHHHLTNPNLGSSPRHHDPRLMTAFPLSPSSVRNTNVEVDSDSDCPNISNIEPTYAEAEDLSIQFQIIKIDDLEQIRELGSGTYGVVYHGKWRGTDVAVKRIKLSSFAEIPSKRERLIADFWKEALILSSLHHPNVVSFYGMVCDGPDGSLATVTEFMVSGSLKQFLQKKDRTIDRHKRLIIAMDAAFGMEYLHGKNIVHFDLKCENLLVNMTDPHRPVCKIGDVGLSMIKQKALVSGGVRGTFPWMAPELLSGKSERVTERIDVYSFGIVMWEMLTGEEPYANMRFTSILGDIVNNSLRPQVPSWCDPEWKSLMENCWASDPSERPSFSEISQMLRAMKLK